MPIWLNLPNILTILRIIMVGFMPFLFRAGQFVWAMVVFITAFLTDFLDGYIARKKNLITDFGKLMDPFADKLMLIVTLLLFGLYDMLPWIFFWAVFAKEMVMIVGGLVLLNRKEVVYANKVGKAATGCFAAAVVLTFLKQWVYPVNIILMTVAFILSFTAMVTYFIRFVVHKGQEKP